MAARVPLVLLPAMLCDAELYRAQIEGLADVADARVVVASESSLARSAEVVLAQAPPRFALAGTSFGGNVALEVVAAAPARVAGLWLTGSNPGAHSDPGGARRLSEHVHAGAWEPVVDELARRCIHPGGPRAKDALATLRAMALRAGPDVFLRQNESVITRADRAGVLATLRVPTLLLWGRHDQFSPPERAHAIAARMTAAQVVVVEDCGHLPTLERPEIATAAVGEWLAAVRSAR
jgi:pimeloyl-ACP methyl ester carboxylesterase